MSPLLVKEMSVCMTSRYKNALPKSEARWSEGVQMKASDAPFSEREIARLKKELMDIPDPSFGRIQELKEKIRNKTFLTKQNISGAAERVVARFMGKE